MTIPRTILVVSMATSMGACSTVAPVPVTLDASVPAAIQSHGLRATLDVLPRGETNRLFGADAGVHFGVVELKVENRGALPVSVERKAIRIVTPEAQELDPVSPLAIANQTRGQAMISTGNNFVDAIQLVFAVARLAQNSDVAAQWDSLMPQTFKVAAGDEGRMLLAFSVPHWAPGLWRLELPFHADADTIGPHLSIPLTFKATALPPN